LQPIAVIQILVEITVSWFHENLKSLWPRPMKVKAHRSIHCIFDTYGIATEFKRSYQSICMERKTQKNNNYEIQILTFYNHGKLKLRQIWKGTKVFFLHS
jgi:hypothetical protein